MSKSKKASKRKLLSKIYTDPSDPGSFGGVDRLWKSVKRQKKKKVSVKYADVTKFLKGQETYTLHKQIRRKFTRNPTIVKGIDAQWQADLADVSQLSAKNDGHNFLLTVVDCFSKFAWVVPVKQKSSVEMLASFQKLFANSNPRIPKRLQTDKGKEFLNASVQQYLKKMGVEHFVTNNETKAAMVERFNRTLKSRMYAYFTENNTTKYIDILEAIVKSYNESEHRTIGMRPCDVKEKDEERLWQKMYGAIASIVVPSHSSSRSSSSSRVYRQGVNINNAPKTGSCVRISKAKTTFDKGYLPNWTRELFKVKQVKKCAPKRLYKLTDYNGEDIEGTFYPEEVQRVKDNKVYEIEKILKKRTLANGEKQLLIKWKGWPDKFNSWISEGSVEE
jgi:transposase InsO family protein